MILRDMSDRASMCYQTSHLLHTSMPKSAGSQHLHMDLGSLGDDFS
jgi:hypothetical protein